MLFFLKKKKKKDSRGLTLPRGLLLLCGVGERHWLEIRNPGSASWRWRQRVGVVIVNASIHLRIYDMVLGIFRV